MGDLEISDRDRIIDAALRLAATENWRRITVRDIADTAEVSLASFAAQFSTRDDVLVAFAMRVDGAVLAGNGTWDGEESARDRLFDVLMRRFDVLTPYKDALRSLMRETRSDPAVAARTGRQLVRSMRWMLEAAALPADGPMGCARAAALTGAYVATLRVWLTDDSPDQARTMATLDAQLRRLEEWARSFDRPLRRGRGFGPFRGNRWGGEAEDGSPDTAGGAI